MAILITGGCGYIGSHTCLEMLAAGTTSLFSTTITTLNPKPCTAFSPSPEKSFRSTNAISGMPTVCAASSAKTKSTP